MFTMLRWPSRFLVANDVLLVVVSILLATLPGCGSSAEGGGGAGGVGGTAGSTGGSAGTGGNGPGGAGGSSVTGTGGGTGAGGAGTGGAFTGTGGSAAGGATGSGGATIRDAGASGGAGGGDAGRDVGAAGGTRTGGSSARGGATGGGGVAGAGGTTGRGGSAGTGGAAGAGGTTTTGTLFGNCRFHFCAIDSTTNASIRAEIDYFTSGWLLGVNFNHGNVCTSSASGGTMAGKLPVMVAYIAADYVKRTHNLCDCNVSGCSGGDLCKYGAQYITQDWATILNLYKSNSDGFANCMGGRPIVFAMEPDWYQYYAAAQTQKWTPAQAGTNMTALVNALKSNPALKAYFSLDISPWIPNNGADWYSNFDLGLFTFISTSGGGTDANNTRIRANNAMTWAGIHTVTGKPILADTGYGAAGASAGEDTVWNVAANINARIADGVVGICQYNPTSSWGSTIAGIRGQLNQPRYCP